VRVDDGRKGPEERLVILRPFESRRDADHRRVANSELAPLSRPVETVAEQKGPDRHVREDAEPVGSDPQPGYVALFDCLADGHEAVGEVACREVGGDASRPTVARAILRDALQHGDGRAPCEPRRETALDVGASQMRLDEVDPLTADDRRQRQHRPRVPEPARRDYEDASAHCANSLDELRIGRANRSDVAREAVVVGQLQQAEQGNLGSTDPEPVDHLEHAAHSALQGPCGA
jgi:hypothetical protein